MQERISILITNYLIFYIRLWSIAQRVSRCYFAGDCIQYGMACCYISSGRCFAGQIMNGMISIAIYPDYAGMFGAVFAYFVKNFRE